MYGAILGDMIGAPYEFDRGTKTKDFPLFTNRSQFTDDTVMTIAVAEALMEKKDGTVLEVKELLIRSMQKWGRRYPNSGYGGRFAVWLQSEEPKPYDSYGNGSAMRVSSAGWLYDTLDKTREMARCTSEVTHNHPEGVKGAEATASAIFLARTGCCKEEIKDYVIREFDYDLSRTCDEIRPTYHHVESCQQTVPEAITAFMEGNDFEDVIRTAVSLGGDCDTLTCIAGSIAEAFYGVPVLYQAECKNRLPADMLEVLDRFDAVRGNPRQPLDTPLAEHDRADKPDNRICFDVGDITRLEVDAIVNATNTSLLGSGGVDGAIHRAAGPSLAEECMRLKGCKVGEAKITAGWQLKAKHVIHTVGPRYEENNASCAKLLYACYQNSLDLAKQYGLNSIAFPAISTGVLGYPKQEAAEIALHAVSDWLSANSDYGMAVIMSCHSREMLQCYQNVKDFLTAKERRDFCDAV